MSATIEIRVQPADPNTHLPHTFLFLNDGNGFTQGYGFAPQVTGLSGIGQVQSDTDHSFKYTSGQIPLTDRQYAVLAKYINDSIANPPYYSIPLEVQCTTWVNKGLQQAGVWNGLMIGTNPYAQAFIAITQESVNAGFRLANEARAQVLTTVTTTFHASSAFTGAVPPMSRDPLTLDLDNDGLETVGINTTNPILFDHTGEGVKTATGWVNPDDGFLVLDHNGNGMIDNGGELFGDSTPLYAGGKAMDGFEALAQEDTNSDGRVDNLDARFSQLRIWRDLNQDGISQSGELFTLPQEGIAALLVAKTEHTKLLANGNQIADLNYL